jgi:signal transduction histidine kinase/ActR/RegA family two-component response regulator
VRRGLGLLALAAVLPLILLAGGLALFLLWEQQDLMQDSARHQVDQIIAGVDRELQTQIELLKVLAQSPILDGDDVDLAAFYGLAVRFQSQLPLWHRIILADTDGNQVMKTGVPFGTRLERVVDDVSYRRVLQTRGPAIGDAVRPPGHPDNPPRASFRVPVLREGKLRYVLTGVVSTERLAALAERGDTDPGWLPYLVDASDRIVASPRRPEIVGNRAMPPTVEARAQSRGGLYDGISHLNEPLVTAFRKSDLTGWSAHLAIPLALYRAPQVHALWTLAATGLSAVGLSVLFALLLHRQLQVIRQEGQMKERAVRMEALGRTTGGVAHDFNNLLMVILGNLELLQKRNGEPRLERYITAIRSAAERGAELTTQLLAFSRGRGTQSEVIDLHEHLTGRLDMIRQSLRGDIVVEPLLASPACVVKVDPLQLDLAILNIAVNAADAMPNGGALRIATRAAQLPGGSGRAAVALSISDSGTGIPAHALPHVFEPFFTTKAVGKGTGLGLSQVYGFARAAGGSAEIASGPGRGTTVTLYLPLAAESVAQPSRTAAPVASEPVRPSLSILLVDDNEEVRGVTASFLQEAGCRVEVAPHAAAGLDSLHRRRPDVLVSDLVMPGEMDGLALAREARRRWPDLPIILVSGYSQSAAAAMELGFPLIMKPYQMANLIQEIDRHAAMASNGHGLADRAAVADRAGSAAMSGAA